MSARKQFTETHKASPYNSTDFTNCCGAAVLQDDTVCPRCERTVLRYEPIRTPNCRMCGKPRNACYC